MAIPAPAPRLGRHQMTPNITELCSIYTDRPPSCMDFSPSVERYLIIGTYELQEDTPNSQADQSQQMDEHSTGALSGSCIKPQNRAGSLLLYEIVRDQLLLTQEVSTDAAVWDLEFCPSQPQYFATALSIGKVDFYHLEEDQSKQSTTCKIKYMFSHQVRDPSTAVTYLAWHPTNPSYLSCTLSDGEVRRIDLKVTTTWDGIEEPFLNSFPINQHVLTPKYSQPSKEVAWCCSWDSDTDAVYSGGEDSALRVSTDAGKDQQEMDALMNTVVTGFAAGVTSILLCKIPGREDPLAIVGSQDECIRVYNVKDLGVTVPPTPGPRIPIANLKLKGPIYRLKLMGMFDSKGDNRIRRKIWVLASCQQAGTMVLKIVLGDKLPAAPESPTLIFVVGWVDSFDKKHQLCYSIAKPASQIPYQGLQSKTRMRIWGTVQFVTSSYYEKIVRLCVFNAEMSDSKKALRGGTSSSIGTPGAQGSQKSMAKRGPALDVALTLSNDADLIRDRSESTSDNLAALNTTAKDRLTSTDVPRTSSAPAFSESNATDPALSHIPPVNVSESLSMPASLGNIPVVLTPSASGVSSFSTTSAYDPVAASPTTDRSFPSITSMSEDRGYLMATGLVLDSAAAYMTVPTSSATVDPSVIRANSTFSGHQGIDSVHHASAPTISIGVAPSGSTVTAPFHDQATSSHEMMTAPMSPPREPMFIYEPELLGSPNLVRYDNNNSTVSLLSQLELLNAGEPVEQPSLLTNARPDHSVEPVSNQPTMQFPSPQSLSWSTDEITSFSPSPNSMRYSNMVRSLGQDTGTVAGDVSMNFTDLLSDQTFVPASISTRPLPVFSSMQEDQAATAMTGLAATDAILSGTAEMAPSVEDMDATTVGEMIEALRKDMNEPEVMEYTKEQQKHS